MKVQNKTTQLLIKLCNIVFDIVWWRKKSGLWMREMLEKGRLMKT